MSLLQIVFTVLTVVLMSVGQILFKMAAEKISFTLSGALACLQNVQLIAALFVYFFATGMWLYVLKSVPLRMAYPFAALAFISTPLLAHFILKEPLYWNTFVGAVLIFSGIVVSTST